MRPSRRLTIAALSGLALATLVTWSEVRAEQLTGQLSLPTPAAPAAVQGQAARGPLGRDGAIAQIGRIAGRFTSHDRVAAVAIYDIDGKPLAIRSPFSTGPSAPPSDRGCGPANPACGRIVIAGQAPTAVPARSLSQDRTASALLAATIQDASAVSRAAISRAAISRDVIARSVPSRNNQPPWVTALWEGAAPILLIALCTVGAIQLTVLRPLASTARWMRELRAAQPPAPPKLGGLLHPIEAETTALPESLSTAEAAAEEDVTLHDAAESLWTAERLRAAMQANVQGTRLFVVSSREPHEHVYRGTTITPIVPASGVATALEPILSACDGTWIAHGSGNADRQVVDERDCVRVPSGNPRYTLRRVWLTSEEQQGYYFGFANEGLWPLCHAGHAQPLFRAADWEQYRLVNQKFADAVLEEMEGTEHPFLLVHDHQFALLPALVRAARPDARIAVFWPMPWPGADALGRCPWQKEVLDGLLNADIVSFQTQAHCANFLRTIDRAVECRIEWERFTATRQNHSTIVRPHPINVAAPAGRQPRAAAHPEHDSVATRKELGLNGAALGIGVDRLDDTNGILERFRAVECLFGNDPARRETFTLAQIAVPGRAPTGRSHDLLVEVAAEAERINRRFQTGHWKPILFSSKEHGQEDFRRLYEAADACLVTAAHDGMDLVAREFVAARDDEDGVLILTGSAGGSSTLRDALIADPHDAGQLAERIRTAVEMPPDERRSRMRGLRRVVREHNVYRWASELVSDLSEA
jgi:trehalose-6-phosphate synthase